MASRPLSPQDGESLILSPLNFLDQYQQISPTGYLFQSFCKRSSLPACAKTCCCGQWLPQVKTVAQKFPSNLRETDLVIYLGWLHVSQSPTRALFLIKTFFKKRFYLFIHERHRERGRDTGRGRSRLHAGSPTWDSIPGPQDHTLGWRQTLNPWAT